MGEDQTPKKTKQNEETKEKPSPLLKSPGLKGTLKLGDIIPGDDKVDVEEENGSI